MKAVILACGLGTRISEESNLKPKPMIEIGGKPILWLTMKLYSPHRVNDFVICCGYKGYVIKGYFVNYFLHMPDVTFDMASNQMQVHKQHAGPWRVTLADISAEIAFHKQHEAALLGLDGTCTRAEIGWQPRWSLEQSPVQTVAWYPAWKQVADMAATSLRQVGAYEARGPS